MAPVPTADAVGYSLPALRAEDAGKPRKCGYSSARASFAPLTAGSAGAVSRVRDASSTAGETPAPHQRFKAV
jgi:hypothetical protein